MNEDEARDVLREAGYLVDVLWSKDDIRFQAANNEVTLTEDEVDEVAEDLINNFDANLGICWDQIDISIGNVKN